MVNKTLFVILALMALALAGPIMVGAAQASDRDVPEKFKDLLNFYSKVGTDLFIQYTTESDFQITDDNVDKLADKV
jgi:hypothetical protein